MSQESIKQLITIPQVRNRALNYLLYKFPKYRYYKYRGEHKQRKAMRRLLCLMRTQQPHSFKMLIEWIER